MGRGTEGTNLRLPSLLGQSLLGRLKRWLPIPNCWWAKFDLLRTLVRRDLDARYKGSLLGNLWPLVNQIAQLLIYTYVFSVVLQVKLNPAEKTFEINDNLDFGLWLFAGLLPWIAFSSGLTQAASSVVGQINLVKKVVFPLSLLPLVPVLTSLIESSFGIAVLIVIVAFSKGLQVSLAYLPLIFLPQVLLTAGLAYFAASLTVFIRDIPQSLGVILNLWLYATPIIYPATKIPEAWRQWIFYLNPMTAIVETYRDLILVGAIRHAPEWRVATLISLVVFVLGASCYRRLRSAFADVL